MAVGCPLLERDGRYERVVTGWVDATHDSTLRFTARLTDAAADLEVALTAEPSPSFEIVRAERTARDGETAVKHAVSNLGLQVINSRVMPRVRDPVLKRTAAKNER